MTATGWTNEPPEAERPAMPVTAHLLAARENRASVLEEAAARSAAADARQLREEEAQRPDPDEMAASMVARGYAPGMLSELAQRLADTEAELQGARAQVAKGERVTERVRGMLERGQVGGLEASRMLDAVTGDPARVALLERRRQALRRQVAEASALIPRAEDRAADPFAEVNAVGRAAHAVFAQRTRDMMARVQAGQPVPARRPFAGPGGDAVRSEMCVHCTEHGVSDEYPAAERAQAGLREVDRLIAAGYSPETARLAATPVIARRQVPGSYGVVMRSGGPILGVE